MWKLIACGARGTPFADIGNYASLVEVAEAIEKMENDQDGPRFFRVYVDTWQEEHPSDADVLSRLEYQSPTRFYLITRNAN
jgi:hypothetical protein